MKQIPLRMFRKIVPHLVLFNGTPCWVWTGCKDPKGYGFVKYDGRTPRKTHRVVYELLVGPIPEGLQLDHLCRNSSCCNPAHLEPVTPGENVRRGDAGKRQSLRTHCPHGHEYTPENTRTRAGKRFCRQCARDRSKNRNKNYG